MHSKFTISFFLFMFSLSVFAQELSQIRLESHFRVSAPSQWKLQSFDSESTWIYVNQNDEKQLIVLSTNEQSEIPKEKTKDALTKVGQLRKFFFHEFGISAYEIVDFEKRSNGMRIFGKYDQIYSRFMDVSGKNYQMLERHFQHGSRAFHVSFISQSEMGLSSKIHVLMDQFVPVARVSTAESSADWLWKAWIQTAQASEVASAKGAVSTASSSAATKKHSDMSLDEIQKLCRQLGVSEREMLTSLKPVPVSQDKLNEKCKIGTKDGVTSGLKEAAANVWQRAKAMFGPDEQGDLPFLKATIFSHYFHFNRFAFSALNDVGELKNSVPAVRKLIQNAQSFDDLIDSLNPKWKCYNAEAKEELRCKIMAEYGLEPTSLLGAGLTKIAKGAKPLAKVLKEIEEKEALQKSEKVASAKKVDEAPKKVIVPGLKTMVVPVKLADGTVLDVDVHIKPGNNGKGTILLTPGLDDRAENWHGTMRHLAKKPDDPKSPDMSGHTLIAISLRGQGKTADHELLKNGFMPRTIKMDDQVHIWDSVAKAMKEKNVPMEKIHLVGHSYGGQASFEVAAKSSIGAPGSGSRLMSVNGLAPFVDHFQNYAPGASMDPTKVMANMLEKSNPLLFRQMTENAMPIVMKNAHQQGHLSKTTDWDANPRRIDGVAAMTSGVVQTNTRARIEDIAQKHPKAVINIAAGGKDKLVPNAAHEAATEWIKENNLNRRQGSLHINPDHGHRMTDEDPKSVANWIAKRVAASERQYRADSLKGK